MPFAMFLLIGAGLVGLIACAEETPGTPEPTPPATTSPTPTPDPTPPIPPGTPTPSPTPDPTPTPTFDAEQISLVDEVGGLTALVAHPEEEMLFLVTEQPGRVLAVPNEAGVEMGAVVLDIRDRVSTVSWEAGLLDLAFHPDYPDTPHLYIYYVADGPARTVLSRLTPRQDPLETIDPATEEVVLEIPQEDHFHNGGRVLFGPDGYLYLSIGDGGSGLDPGEHGQNPGTLLGTIIRIDVDNPDEGMPYGIPPDNPFVDDPEARDEVWAYGLRNPWRFSIHPETGELWVGNVGEDAWEEVLIARPGGNYGWSVTEGGECYPPGADCDPEEFDGPLHRYEVHRDGNCAVTGGYTYRGQTMPDLQGVYVFGDFCSGRVWGLWHDGEQVTAHGVLAETGLSITSFGEGPNGELYVVTHEGGIHAVVSADEAEDAWLATVHIGGGPGEEEE